MRRGGFTLAACSSLAIAACSAPNVQVRALPDPAAKLRQGGNELANARSMLALGNAGLALEGFRTLRITQPTNPDVYAGIAECYVAMGRYDLARTNYETALAYTPHDPALLAALARSLDNQGETERAAAVREELTHLANPPAQPKSIETATAQAIAPVNAASPQLAPQVGSITVKLPPVRPLVSAASQQSLQSVVAQVKVEEPTSPLAAVPKPVVALAKAELPPVATPRPTATESEAAAVHLQPSTVAVTVEIGRVAVRTADESVLKIPIPAIAASAPIAATIEEPTVHLQPSTAFVPIELGRSAVRTADTSALKTPVPVIVIAQPEPLKMTVAAEPVVPSRPAAPKTPVPAAMTLVARPTVPSAELPKASALVAQLIAMEPAIKPRDPDLQAMEQDFANGPRLERISSREVALVTTPTPLWKRQMASAPAQHAAVQWLPIRSAEARPAIQLLNAARTQGLAASSRMALANRGWRRIDIGDFGEVRQRSLVLYSGDHAPLARRLAAQFSCKAIKVDGKPAVIVLLGRDAASKKASSLKA